MLKVHMVNDSIGFVFPTWIKQGQRIEVAEDVYTRTGRIQLRAGQRGHIVTSQPDTFDCVRVHIDGFRRGFNSVPYTRLIPLENEKAL